MTKNETTKRGGARPGAGRKPRPAGTKLVAWHLRFSTIKAVKLRAAMLQLSQGQVVDQILSDWFTMHNVFGRRS